MQRFLLFKKPLMIFVQVCICDMKGKIITMASLVAQLKKKPPAIQETWETWVRSLCQEDPLKKEMATTPVFLPGEFHGQKSLAGYSPWGRKESDTTEMTEHTHRL